MNRKYEISANYTVEAAFVVPIIFGIIFSMIYMVFVLHDKIVLHENLRANVICIDENEGKSKKKSFADAENKKLMSKKNISKNLKVFKIKNINYNVGKTYIKAEVNGISKINIPVIDYFMKRTKKIYIKTKYLKIKPETMLRYKNTMKQIKKMGSDNGK